MKNANPLTVIPLHVRELFESRIEKVASGCHEYQGRLKKGYGVVDFARREYAAHRVSWVLRNGPLVDTDLVIHHSCENRRCVNADHLRAVTQRENLLATATTLASQNHKKTRCKRGHEFNGENTIRTTAGRRCRACYLVSKAQYLARRRASVASQETHLEASL